MAGHLDPLKDISPGHLAVDGLLGGDVEAVVLGVLQAVAVVARLLCCERDKEGEGGGEVERGSWF